MIEAEDPPIASSPSTSHHSSTLILEDATLELPAFPLLPPRRPPATVPVQPLRQAAVHHPQSSPTPAQPHESPARLNPPLLRLPFAREAVNPVVHAPVPRHRARRHAGEVQSPPVKHARSRHPTTPKSLPGCEATEAPETAWYCTDDSESHCMDAEDGGALVLGYVPSPRRTAEEWELVPPPRGNPPPRQELLLRAYLAAIAAEEGIVDCHSDTPRPRSCSLPPSAAPACRSSFSEAASLPAPLG
jgi:hypothetical protein